MSDAPIDRYPTQFSGEHLLESHHSLDEERSVTLTVRYKPGSYSVDATAVEERFEAYVDSFPSSVDNGGFFSSRPEEANDVSATQWFEDQLAAIYSDLEDTLEDPEQLGVRIEPTARYNSTDGAAATIDAMTIGFEDDTALFDD